MVKQIKKENFYSEKKFKEEDINEEKVYFNYNWNNVFFANTTEFVYN